MLCSFLRTHCYKVLITALALLVAFEYGFGVLYEEHRRLNEVYFTFNLTLPPMSTSVQNGSQNASESSYVATHEQTLMALQSSNSSDPFQLDLLLDPSNSSSNDTLNFTQKPSMCPLVSPLLGESSKEFFCS